MLYDKRFRENLKANTPFVRCSQRLDLPMKSGNQYEMFMYVPLGALTTQTTEGTVGSSLSINVLNTTATIGEYADFPKNGRQTKLNLIGSNPEMATRRKPQGTVRD